MPHNGIAKDGNGLADHVDGFDERAAQLGPANGAAFRKSPCSAGSAKPGPPCIKLDDRWTHWSSYLSGAQLLDSRSSRALRQTGLDLVVQPNLCCQLKLYPPTQVYFRRSLISIETTFTPPVRSCRHRTSGLCSASQSSTIESRWLIELTL